MARDVTIRFFGDTTHLESKMGRLGGLATAAGAALAAGVVAGGAGLLKIGSDFDSAFDAIRVGTGATGEVLAGLEGSFRNVVRDVPTDFGNAATAIADLNTRLGLSGEDLEVMSGTILNLSRITGTDLSSNITSISRLFGDFGIKAELGGRSIDQLFRASQATGIGIDVLAEKMTQFGAPLRQMGFGFEESAALISKFEKEGVNGELVMGSLRIALGKLAREGKEPVKAFQEQVAAIKAAGDAGKANALALELFGARAGPDMAAAIREGRFELGDLLDTITNGEDSVYSASRATEDFGEKWTRIKNRVFLALEPVAMRLFDGLGRGMDALGPLLDRLSAKWQEWAPVVESALGRAREVVASAVAVIVEAFERIRPALDDVVAAFSSGFEAVQAVVSVAVDVLMQFWERFGSHLVEHVQRALGIVVEAAQDGLRVVKGVFDFITGVLTLDWSKAWGGIQQVVSGAWALIGDVAQAGVNLLSTVIGAGMAVISQAWGAVWGGMKKVAAGMWDGLKDAFRSAINWIIRAWNGLEFKIPGFDPPGPGPTFAGFTLGVPDIPELADGGIVRARPGGTVVRLGEAGDDEAVVPLPRGTSASGAMVHIGTYVAGKATASQVAADLWWMWRTGGAG